MKQEKRMLRKQTRIESDDPKSDEIHTTLFLQETNSDYKIVIHFPTIEYSIPSKNFTFIKTLSKGELAEFISQRFQDWQLRSIELLGSFDQFSTCLKSLHKADRLGQPNCFARTEKREPRLAQRKQRKSSREI